VRTFIVVALIVVSGVYAAGEQARATQNPCIDSRHRHPRLLPVDEASSQPDFAAYRAGLRMAVERRDINAVVAAMDPDIRLDFGGGHGIEMFRKMVAERSETWEELRSALALGGAFTGPGLFAAPYVYARWPERFDSFECAAIVGRNVRVRSAPRIDAAIVTALSYSIVRLRNVAADGDEWSQVELGDGRTGYVWHAYVRSPVDDRTLFNRIDGRWRMTAFVAGD
jgi:hypothetical protein